MRLLHDDDTTIGRGQHGVRILRDGAWRIAEKLQHEHSNNPQRPGPAAEQLKPLRRQCPEKASPRGQ